ncbi:MAG TPA: GNAT family N-acetyltransferase [Candidatus Limnocylindrales bacterium]|nr:GNAT family N-acetyltransferase [Candidatus Limnocylindrales bacterium]
MTTVRPETTDDCDAVAALHARAWQARYAGILPDDLLAGLDPSVWAQRRREQLERTDRPFTSLVAEHEGSIAGFVIFGPYRVDQDITNLDPEVGEILAIYVDPDRWRGGVGGALMRAALRELKQPEVRLWVLAENKQAQGFYRKHGLSPDGVTALYQPRGTEIYYPEVRFAIVRR